MLFSKFKHFSKYALIAGTLVTTSYSLHENNYDINSLGIVRFTRAAATVLKIGATYKNELYGSGLEKGSPQYNKLKSEIHKKSAEKLLDLCCTNKGVYIKVGQHIATLDYILPSEFVKTMKILYSHAPKNDLKDVYKVLRQDLKKNPEEIFESFDPEPLGTASLAQVHKAVLKDGTCIAVKVQHPYVQGNAKVDLKTMEYLVKLMSFAFPEFKFQWLVDETKKNIPQELNFEQEGKNAEKIQSLFKNTEWLRVPKIIWDLTTPRVLTMEFVEGGQVNDLDYIKEQKIDPYDIIDKLGKLYSQMIFKHGFVHSDPHPGNILISKSERGDCNLTLLDHGLYAVLSDEFRLNYANFWLSILNRNRQTMKLHSKQLGIDGDLYGMFACMVTGRSWESINKGIVIDGVPSKGEMDFVKQNLSSILPQMSTVLDSVNRQMILIFKTNDLIRGIEHTLKTSKKMRAFKVMSECCVNSVYDQKKMNCSSNLEKLKIQLAQFWALLKLTVYYKYLQLTNFSIRLFV
ncbi:aarF domain-containing kinase 1 [Harmonia axyridis]|uniref:aarF domain-containing kinase 1 n=1 Tax=Harmonia axyridis TaxID=115357 RepID=UPI001E279362|nr:aarF domain-containing kinase 1 [Harmonia axyridis]